jgi:hypothetical protein
MSPVGRRLAREARTVNVMVALYCRQTHAQAGVAATAGAVKTVEAEKTAGLCDGCSELLAYSQRRLDACRFGPRKPTCVRCTVHCFNPAMRDQIRAVMRYSGPRMLIRHPLLAVAHLLDRRRTPAGTTGE